MKRTTKIIFIVFGILFLLVAIAAFIISPVTKRYIEKNSKELVGRAVTMEKFQFNIFTGSLRVIGFNMKEEDEQESFVRFDTLFVDVKLFDLLRHKVMVNQIHFSDMRVQVWQKGDVFNFSDIIKKFESTDTLPATSAKKPKPWEIGIYDIQLRRGSILYNDLLVRSKWDMQDLNLKIPGVYFSGKETDIGFNLLFSDGGTLGAKLLYDIENSGYRIQLDLEHFSIEGLLPYLQQTMRLGTLSGYLDAHVHVSGEMQHIMNSVVQGTVAVRSFDMRDDRGELVFAADSLLVDMAEVSLAESKYILNEFSLKGASTRYVAEKDSSNNFTYLIKETVALADSIPADPKAEPAALHFSIAKVNLQGIALEFKDNSLQMPFICELKDIAVTAENFDPDKVNHVTMQGKVGNTGMFNVYWNGNFNDISSLDLKVGLNSVELRDFTPYSMEYFAYPITGGIMTFSSHNVVNKSILKGTNSLDIFKCNVDKQSEAVKPAVNVPLRLALYVLKDREDKIKIDLPVEGDIRSPKFSYKKIIIQTLCNVLIKVSLAPLDFLAGSMGLKADQLDEIEFSNMQEDYTSAQYDRFNQLASIVLSKPDLVLEIVQDINYTQAAREHSMFCLKRDYYLKGNPGKTADNLEALDKSEIAKIKDNDPELIKYADSLSGGDIYVKAVALYKDRIGVEIGKWAEYRNQLLKDYLVTRRNVPSGSVKISILPWVQNRVYGGKSVFRTTLSLPGEEPLTSDAVEGKQENPDE